MSEPGSSLKHKKVVKSNSSEKVSSREWETSKDDANTNPNDNVKPGPSRAVEKTRATITRNVKKDTVENWKYSSLEKYDGQDWLDFDVDKDGHVIALKCKICSTYSSNIENIKKFSHAWAFEGSVNLRVQCHGPCKRRSPQICNGVILEKEFHFRRKKAEKLRDNRQQSIVPGIVLMQAADLQKTKKKFDIAYLIAKEELPMTKYAAIIDLEKKHGVDLGTTYCNEMQAATFITNTGEEFGSQLKQKLSNVNFLSILTDASIDASIIEKEAVLVRYFESKPVDSNEVEVCYDFVSLPDLESGKAGGVVTSIEDSFKEIEAYDQLTEKIVAFGADGASVNQGKHGGAIAELRKKFGDWIIYSWCTCRIEMHLSNRDAHVEYRCTCRIQMHLSNTDALFE